MQGCPLFDVVHPAFPQLITASATLQDATKDGFGEAVKGCSLFDAVHPAFPLQTTALPTLQGALKYCLGEAVALCNMPEPCKFVSLATCQKRFRWTYKEVDLTSHPVVSSYFHINELLTKDHPSFKTAFAGFLGGLSEEGFHCRSYCVHSR